MKVYADTSVIGGYFDREFQEWSVALWDEFIAGTKHLLFSELTAQELEFAREEIKELINEIPLENRTDISITDEAVKLAETYITEGVLSNKSYNDALHIALATLNNADILASWNFKHIVNIDRIRLYNSINFRIGYRIIEIRTPLEILKQTDNE